MGISNYPIAFCTTAHETFEPIKMNGMKKRKIIYWTTTAIIALFEGLRPVLTSQTALAKEGIRHLGYPAYFGTALVVFKGLGCLALIVPQVPKQVKEWAYAGFAFDFAFATISKGAVDGINARTFSPLVALAILFVSYGYYHKLNGEKLAARSKHKLIHTK